MSDSALQGRRILVVEDEYLVAESLVTILEEAGAVVVGPIGWLDDAMDFIGAADPQMDGAILDVNLHGEVSYPIADALLAKGVHFIFVTGYDGRALDAAYRGYPRCEKPFVPAAIVTAVAALPK